MGSEYDVMNVVVNDYDFPENTSGWITSYLKYLYTSSEVEVWT